jgi:gas vesicle protein
MAKNTGRNWAVGALVAGVAGYVAGILTAPKSGKETRKDIQSAALKAKREAEAKLKTLHAELDDLIAEGKQKATSAKATGKKELDTALKAAQAAKKKAREMLSAIHEGDADDEDLQAAITEVKSSIKHLGAFLKKNAEDKK